MPRQRAQELAPGAISTLVAEAYYYYYGFRDYTRALEITARALAIAPNDRDVNALQTYLSRRLGRMRDAADGMITIREMDPKS